MQGSLFDNDDANLENNIQRRSNEDLKTHPNTLNACEESLAQFPSSLRPTLFHNFLPQQSANAILERLLKQVNWQQPLIRIAGNIHPIPRLQSWQGSNSFRYTYSRQTFYAEAFHPLIERIRLRIEELGQFKFNSVLCNLYRDGQDSVSWHADDEPELGSAPVIASYTLGTCRDFQIKDKSCQNNKNSDNNKNNHKNKTSAPRLIKLPLPHNSLLIMPAGFQEHYIHQIAKTKKLVGPRINLTFRYIHESFS